MSFPYYRPVAGGQSFLCVTGKVELFRNRYSSKTLFTWLLVLGWGGEQDPYNQYVISGCSTIDVMSCCGLEWVVVVPHPLSFQNRCAGLGKGDATENLEVECFYLGELCVLWDFSVEFIPGPCVSVWVNTNACIKGRGMILLHGKVKRVGASWSLWDCAPEVMVFLLSAGVRRMLFVFCPINFGKYVQRVVLAEQAWRLDVWQWVSGAAVTNSGLDAAVPQLPFRNTCALQAADFSPVSACGSTAIPWF